MLAKDESSEDPEATDRAIRTDPRLTEHQRVALLAVYRSYLEANEQST